MKTIFQKLQKEPVPMYVVYNVEKDKLFIISQDKLEHTNPNFNIVLVLSSSLISMLKMLSIPLSKSKSLILISINKDLSEGDSLLSNTCDLLFNKFKLQL